MWWKWGCMCLSKLASRYLGRDTGTYGWAQLDETPKNKYL